MTAELVPDKLIVQAWRAQGWPRGSAGDISHRIGIAPDPGGVFEIRGV